MKQSYRRGTVPGRYYDHDIFICGAARVCDDSGSLVISRDQEAYDTRQIIINWSKKYLVNELIQKRKIITLDNIKSEMYLMEPRLFSLLVIVA